MKNKTITTIMVSIAAITILSVIIAVGLYWGSYGMFGVGGGNLLPMMGLGRGRGVWPGSKPDVLTIEEAENAINNYLSGYRSDEELHIGEIMIFDNQAYAQVVEEETGIGAFEVLVDPYTNNVFYEQGANMMWNLRYGHMRGSMMGSVYYGDGEDMSISGEEAVEIASEYLSSNNSNLSVDDRADPFYGYYTIHTMIDGEVVGMLSVNGYGGQVIIHTWHGDFIEMSEHA